MVAAIVAPHSSWRVKPAAGYTKDVRPTKQHLLGCTLSMKLRVRAPSARRFHHIRQCRQKWRPGATLLHAQISLSSEAGLKFCAMSSSARASLGAIVVLLLVAAGLFGLVRWIVSLPPTFAALVIGAFGFVAARLYESWRDSRQRLHDKKREVYAKLLAPMMALHLQIVEGEESPGARLREKMTVQMIEATFDAVLYASDDVLKLWAQLREPTNDGGMTLFLYMRLITLMRKDVGGACTNITEADLVRLFITHSDADFEAFAESAAKAASRT
ncbi:MAG TPA: hypothetical protein VGQ76_16720 [Thermoanaerobaculia bacterium]|nr:hypothetical protein [Thermoanaerobaculia bacterium]